MPPELDDDKNVDRDDDAFGGDEMPYDKLMAMLKGDKDDGGDDDIAFGRTSDTKVPEVETVSVEDGVDLIDAAQNPKPQPKAKAPEDADPPAKAPEGEDSSPSAPSDDLDAILTGLPDTARDTVRSRVSAADEVMSIFKGRDAELQMHGVKPAEAVKRLVEINSYAMKSPGEYIAWAAVNLAADPVAVLTQAAEKLGLKVTSAAADDDDPFEDPGIKQMRAELAAYKARDTLPTIGPDAPKNRVMNDLEAFKAASPHFDSVAPYLAAQASAHAQATGKTVTIDDLKRFYDSSVAALGIAAPAQQANPAAQAQQPVAQVAQRQTAAPSDSVKRAMAASKSLDGSGHGAGRRPALAADAPLSDVLSHFWAQQAKG